MVDNMKKTLNQIKEELQVKTSEEILEIMKQPEETCPMLENVIGELDSISRNLQQAKRYEDWDDVASAQSDIDYLADSMNDISFHIADIRTWGQDWKDLAKRMFEALPEKKQKEFYLED